MEATAPVVLVQLATVELPLHTQILLQLAQSTPGGVSPAANVLRSMRAVETPTPNSTILTVQMMLVSGKLTVLTGVNAMGAKLLARLMRILHVLRKSSVGEAAPGSSGQLAVLAVAVEER